jgi:hypothetical protein
MEKAREPLKELYIHKPCIFLYGDARKVMIENNQHDKKEQNNFLKNGILVLLRSWGGVPDQSQDV